MKKSRYSPDQVAFGLRQAEEGTTVAEVCRKMGISRQLSLHRSSQARTWQMAAADNPSCASKVP